ncbi:MAG: hypothetical protein Salg2KO_19310 [Salibacteraceae bacterium]
MIYISSSSVKSNRIVDSINKLTAAGFDAIELSGGTMPYKGLEQDLRSIKEKGVKLLAHNYFPPPSTPFVLNLASLDKTVADLSMEHALRALEVSEMIGATKFGIHAGFLINIPVSEIGKPITEQPLFNRDASLDAFANNVRRLQEKSNVELYIENNVVAPFNLRNFNGVNPFFLTDSQSYQELKERFDFNLLLDVAHLKVSSYALGLNFTEELNALIPESDYIHISDNDGSKDSNEIFETGSELHQQLSNFEWKNKTITLEVYDGLEAVRTSYNAVHSLL